MADKAESYISPEAYLETELHADYRSEYVGGEAFAMVGSSPAHVSIVTNLVIELGSQLRGSGYRVYTNALRIHIVTKNSYTYPDLVITCGEEQYHETHKDTLLNPCFITEALSPSTEAYDRGLKFAHYQAISSLQEYLLVSQEHVNIERYLRQSENSWLYIQMKNLNDTFTLPTIGCQLSLQSVYTDINL